MHRSFVMSDSIERIEVLYLIEVKVSTLEDAIFITNSYAGFRSTLILNYIIFFDDITVGSPGITCCF